MDNCTDKIYVEKIPKHKILFGKYPIFDVLRSCMERSHSLRGNFLLITILLMVSFGVGSTALGYVIFSKSLRSNAIHASETNLQFLRNEMNTNLNNVLALVTWSRTHPAIIHYLSSDPNTSSFTALTREAGDRLNEEYLGNPAKPYISRIVIAGTAHSKYLQRILQTYYSSDRHILNRIRSLPYFDTLIHRDHHAFYIGVQDDLLSRTKERMLPIISPIQSAYNDSEVGFVYVQLSFHMFTDPMLRYATSENTPSYIAIHDEIYRVSDGQIEKLDREPRMDTQNSTDAVRSDTTVIRMSDGTYEGLYVSAPLKMTDCHLIIPVSVGSKDQLSGFFLIVCIIIGFVSVITLLLMRRLTHRVTTPITLLKQQLSAISTGDFRKNPDIEWKNELGEIGHDINRLATDIEHLMKQRIVDEQEKKDQEYKLLQSQINPHFLYNTLNSIKWMATAQRASGIAEMTTALAHLLKNISKGTSSIVSVREEFRLLDDYFTIQKYRYGGALTVSYHIQDESLLDNQILRFTLQPIAENAVFHGIEPKGSHGQIDITLYELSEKIIAIDIKDDGVGIEEDVCSSILSGDNTGRSGFFRQVGIASVNKRLRYTFGDPYGITITSRRGSFTLVTIRVPKQPQNETYNETPE